MEIYWILELDKVFEAFSYFMVLSYITYPIKETSTNFKPDTGFKIQYFLKSDSLGENLFFSGPILIVLLLLLAIIPAYKVCRKVEGRVFWSDLKLKRLV
jgi:hypothetical protein